MAERQRKTHIRVPSVEGQLAYPPDPVEASETWWCSHARAVQERVERVIARLEAQRDEAIRQQSGIYTRPAGADKARRYARLDGRISGLTTAIEALRGGEDG